MISENMMKRLKKAAGYQRQAILALLPEGMEGHLDVIEKELGAVLKEAMADMVRECMIGRMSVSDGRVDGASGAAHDGSSGSVRKVSID